MNLKLVRRSGSQAGMVLPLTLILMTAIAALTIAFVAFAGTEPLIATHHMENAQARAIAEAGVERALWALTKGETDPAFPGTLPDPLPNPVPAQYNGQYV